MFHSWFNAFHWRIYLEFSTFINYVLLIVKIYGCVIFPHKARKIKNRARNSIWEKRLRSQNLSWSIHKSDFHSFQTIFLLFRNTVNYLVPGIDAPEPVFFCSVEPPDTKSTHDFERALQNLCKEVGYTYLVLKSLLAYSCRFHLEALIQRGSKINFTEVSF